MMHLLPYDITPEFTPRAVTTIFSPPVSQCELDKAFFFLHELLNFWYFAIVTKLGQCTGERNELDLSVLTAGYV